jgi:hypothetical protein
MKQLMLAASLDAHYLALLHEQCILFWKLARECRMQRAHQRDRLSFDRLPEAPHRFFDFGQLRHVKKNTCMKSRML